MVEDQGKKLRDVLISKDSFKQAYLVGGWWVLTWWVGSYLVGGCGGWWAEG